MNKNQQYISDLIDAFKFNMLPALANGDTNAYECIRKANIDSLKSNLPITFTMSELFSAVWLWGVQSGLSLPKQSDFDKDFNLFWVALTSPWPIDEITSAGLKIKKIKTTGQKYTHIYELSNT